MKIILLSLFCLSMHVCQISAAINQADFDAAVTKAGYSKPNAEVYKSFTEGTKGWKREEQAMFLAQLLHESGGFRYTEEIACKQTKCKGQYVDNVGLPGKYYYGRGYIQLTWGANYKAASQALGMGDRLLQNPDVVATDKRISMLVSTWYWKARVRPQIKGKENQFGLSTKAINGPIECGHGPNQYAKNRYQIYLKIADALKLKNKASEKGCYN